MFESELGSLELLFRGKVRDVYAVDSRRLLLVQTDRVSAFDVVFSETIPGKGETLTAISRHWFRETAHLVPNHLLEDAPEDWTAPADHAAVRGRSVVVRRMKPIPVEAVVRGYLAGSACPEYERTGAVCGVELPPGLEHGDALPEPAFTPATKAPRGSHDENITAARAGEIAGADAAGQMGERAKALYSFAHERMLGKGIVLADTKFEFAPEDDGSLVLVDEALTPDSSRYWPASSLGKGKRPESLDKQHLRNWAVRQGWDKSPPAPKLDGEIVRQVADRYAHIRGLILG